MIKKARSLPRPSSGGASWAVYAFIACLVLARNAKADTRQVTCAGASTAVAPVRNARKHIVYINSSSAVVTVCHSSTCSAATAGAVLGIGMTYEDRYYHGPVSCFGSSNVLSIVEE